VDTINNENLNTNIHKPERSNNPFRAFCVNPADITTPAHTPEKPLKTIKKFKMYEKPCQTCGKIFRRAALISTPPKYCCLDCMNADRAGKGKEKYVISEHWQENIRKMYANGVGKGEVSRIAKKIGVPRTKITTLAKRKGWLPKNRTCDPYFWDEREIEIIEKTGMYHPKAVQKRLKKEGYHRTLSAIEVKRLQLRVIQRTRGGDGLGMSANELAECMGVDSHKITAAIKTGKLKAKKRPTYEGITSPFYILTKHIREYIVNWLPEININYCAKFWLIDLLANDTANKQEKGR